MGTWLPSLPFVNRQRCSGEREPWASWGKHMLYKISNSCFNTSFGNVFIALDLTPLCTSGLLPHSVCYSLVVCAPSVLGAWYRATVIHCSSPSFSVAVGSPGRGKSLLNCTCCSSAEVFYCFCRYRSAFGVVGTKHLFQWKWPGEEFLQELKAPNSSLTSFP